MTKYPDSACEEHRNVETSEPVCILCMQQEIDNLQAMYNAQCACTDEWAAKYCAERDRKAETTLMARIAELEQSLATVNARLAKAQDAVGAQN